MSTLTDSRLGQRLREVTHWLFGIDRRALAALRISLGALLLLDLLLRSRFLGAFYTDFGVLPRTALRSQHAGYQYLSVHSLSGTALFQTALFVLAGVLAVGLLVGYRTRVVALLSFLLVVSLHARNPVVLNGGDSLLRRLLFWSMLLPTGKCWSIDAVRTGGNDHDETEMCEQLVSLPSAGLLGQVLVVYLSNAGIKLRGDLWLRGTAVQHVFSLDQFTVLLGDLLTQYPAALKLFNWVWITLLFCSLLLVVLPGRLRVVFVSLFVLMHGGMLVTMQLGIFPLISIAALIPFYPPVVWDRLQSLPVVRSLGARLSEGVESVTGERTGQQSNTRREFSRVRQWLGRLQTVIALVGIVVMLTWNGAILTDGIVPHTADTAIEQSDHSWDMFAPVPLTVDGWYVSVGTLDSGETVDPFHPSSDVSFDRPPDIAATYPTARWRKYLTTIHREDSTLLQQEFASYLCRRWNRTSEQSLRSVELYFMSQPTRLHQPEPITKTKLTGVSCQVN